jgi:hypothetical protein
MILSRTLMFMLDCVDDVFPVCKKTEQGRQVMRPFCSTLVPLISGIGGTNVLQNRAGDPLFFWTAAWLVGGTLVQI